MLNTPLIAFVHGRRGVMSTARQSLEDFSKSLLAVTFAGPKVGDFVIDAQLQKHVVSAVHPPSVSWFSRFRSLFSPQVVTTNVAFSDPCPVSFEEAKAAVEAALKSSKSVSEYWEESRVPIDKRLRNVVSASSFAALWRALK
jgi:hypothetical protein